MLVIKQTELCIICDNKIADFKYGAICGLTNKKPDFQEKCGVIKLDKHFEEKIIQTNIEYEAVLKTRTDVYGLFVFYNIITVLIFIIGYLIGRYILEVGVLSAAPIIIMSTSIFTLAKAFGPFNDYNSRLKLAKEAKTKIDTIAKVYGYEYDIHINHLKDSLGNLSYSTDLKLRRTNNIIN